jgi:tRNA 2-thiouridine synthesizing protein A
MSETTTLDITKDVCPMTLVRVRMAMDRIRPGDSLRIRLAAGEPVGSVPRTLRDEGHELVSVEKSGEDFEVTVRKKA